MTAAAAAAAFSTSAFARRARARLPLSFTASLAIHLALLVLAGVLLRTMPPTIGRVDTGPPPIRAALVMVAPVDIVPPLALPPLPEPDFAVPMLPLPNVPPSRTTTAQGLSANPATVVAAPELIPVGRASYGGGDRHQLFGGNLADSMRARYPDVAARLPRINGTLSLMYPTRAALQGRSLSLAVLLSIDREGRVTDARIEPNDPDFAMAILTALKNASFTPATIAGKPIPYWTVMSFDFWIDGPTGANGRLLSR